jgi:hypothetical protein
LKLNKYINYQSVLSIYYISWKTSYIISDILNQLKWGKHFKPLKYMITGTHKTSIKINIFRRDICTKISTNINENLLRTILQDIVTFNLTYSKKTILCLYGMWTYCLFCLFNYLISIQIKCMRTRIKPLEHI